MRRKLVIALAIGLVFYALSDVLLWQRIFVAHSLYQYDKQYQTGHVAALIGILGTGMVLLYEHRLWAIWYGLALYTMIFGGLEDVLYYVLDGRPLPSRCPWLDDSRLILFRPVTGSSLVLSAAVWMLLWGTSLLAPSVVPRFAPAPMTGLSLSVPIWIASSRATWVALPEAALDRRASSARVAESERR